MPYDDVETYNPWTVVNLVFSQLAEDGLHPVLGEHGDPGQAARDLLIALGIQPAAEGNRKVFNDVHDHLAEIRAAYEAAGEDGAATGSPANQGATNQGASYERR